MRKGLTLAGLLSVTVLAPAASCATPTITPGSPATVEVQPFPGTPDASPQTDVSFPGLPRSEVRSLSVVGARSGPHRGRLQALPGGRGTAFTPARPFVAGERVSVHARVRSRAVGFSFGVAAPVPLAGHRSTVIRHDIRDSNGFTRTFHSIAIHPPIASMSGSDPDPSSAGDIFGDAENSVQAGPLIFSPQGQLIYFQPFHQAAAFNVQVQRYRGQSVLTYWQGFITHSIGIGTDMILDHTYTPIAAVNAGHGYHADLHEFALLPNGDALITAYAAVRNVDLRSVGGSKKGTLLDSIIQEVNIATGHVDWEWHAYGHVRVSESYAGKPGKNPYDFFHVNSVQLLPNGKLLVSARQTWTVYEINMKNGRIAYNFGGKNSSFKIGRGANFEWQHDAVMQPDGTITLFDDGDGYFKSENQSRALRLRVDYKRHRLSLVHAYTNKPSLLSLSQGSMQVLPDGNTFVGWGAQPYFTEFSKRGRQLFSLHFNSPLQSYRGYRFPWSGQPTTPPSIAASASGSGTTVYASWNGATEVTAWEVLTGSSQDPASMTPVGNFTKTDFETTMSISSNQPYVAVQALNSAGQVIGTSAAVSR